MSPTAAIARNVCAVGLGQEHGARCPPRAASCARVDDALRAARSRSSVAEISRPTSASAAISRRAALRLAVELGVPDRGADVRGDRRQQPSVRLAEPARLVDALDADRADRLVADEDRHAEVRLDATSRRPAAPISSNCSARLSSSGSRDRRIFEVRPSPRGNGVAAAPACRARPGTGSRSDRCRGRAARRRRCRPGTSSGSCSPVELDQLVEVELRRRRLADLVDDRQLRGPLAGLVDQAGVLERDAEARRRASSAAARPTSLKASVRSRF